MSIQNKKIFLLTALTLAIVATLAVPYVSHAADTESGFKIIPDECLGSQRPEDKPCDLNSFIQLFVNLAETAFKILPYLAMLMMMWAGFNLITAGGNPEKIQEGKKMVVSVVVGVIIVIFLAWAYAGFVVFALTGDVTIFPGTPFSQEWWGGGEANPRAPNTGCCYVVGFGCAETTQLDCTAKAGQYGGAVPQFMGENQFCDQYKVQCENLTKGCCVPDDTTNKTCYWPDAKKGCLDLPTTHHTITACSYLGQDCTTIEGSGSADDTVTGCCVQPNTCSTTTIADCPGGGSFKQGVDCSDVAECTQGCCIGKTGCTNGKTSCTSGLTSPSSCSELTAECAVGCCIQDTGPSCSNNITAYYCQMSLGGASNEDISCSSFTQCSGGCCTSTCTAGNIDGSCTPDVYQYDAATPNAGCTVNPFCQSVCCLYANALTCSANVLPRNCEAAGDTVIANGACPTAENGECEQVVCWDQPSGTCTTKARTLCQVPNVANPDDNRCDTGCCYIPNDVSCHDLYTRDQCERASGTFSQNTSCTNVDNCNGCCVKKHDTYSCSESWTRGQCTADFAANTFYPGDKCTDVTEDGQKVCTVGCCHYCVDNNCVANPDVCTMLSTQQYCATRSPVVEFVANDPACYELQHRETNPIQCDVVNSN
ncbi:MAG: pilin [Patescibacteria group bacterium]